MHNFVPTSTEFLRLSSWKGHC